MSVEDINFLAEIVLSGFVCKRNAHNMQLCALVVREVAFLRICSILFTREGIFTKRDVYSRCS
jgi:hypothetical protein